jgi:hypothetical protein
MPPYTATAAVDAVDASVAVVAFRPPITMGNIGFRIEISVEVSSSLQSTVNT